MDLMNPWGEDDAKQVQTEFDPWEEDDSRSTTTPDSAVAPAASGRVIDGMFEDDDDEF